MPIRFSAVPSLLLTTLALACAPAMAQEWRVLDGSVLQFTGEVEGAPFTGAFEEFTAEVVFDPASPQEGSIEATVEIRSVDSRNRERDQYMLARDFFYARKYPQAVFRTTAIRAGSGPGQFVADAELTLRGETRPVVLQFEFTEGDPSRLQGIVLLERLDFGVGQGEWSDTGQIANEVRVNVDLSLAPG